MILISEARGSNRGRDNSSEIQTFLPPQQGSKYHYDETLTEMRVDALGEMCRSVFVHMAEASHHYCVATDPVNIRTICLFCIITEIFIMCCLAHRIKEDYMAITFNTVFTLKLSSNTPLNFPKCWFSVKTPADNSTIKMH